MRRPLVAGNWKMNLTRANALKLVEGIAAGLAKGRAEGCDIAVAPPFVYLDAVGSAIQNTPIQLGAQDTYYATSGAYTGEISPQMLADIGAKYVIIGHSERRHTISHLEDDQMINRKVRATQAAGLIPILCVGETLAERDADETLDVLTFQLTAGLIGARVESADDLVVAYEPVWAIGTGRTATPEQAQEAHAHLRTKLRELAGGAADQVRILYGGSVKPDNAGELMSKPDVDGGLIGGASLKADSFVGIITATLAAGG